MTDRRFLFWTYGACAGLAAGSFLQWVSGPLGDPVFRDPLPTLLGAGLASLALWRWSAGGRRWLLAAIGIVAALCVALAVYAVYDIHDLYASSGDLWLSRIGVGLVLTLLSAVALGVLCAVRSLHEREHGAKSLARDRQVWLAALVLCALGAGAVWIVQPFAKDPDQEWLWMEDGPDTLRPAKHALHIAGGRSPELSWGVRLFGNTRKENCWAIDQKVLGETEVDSLVSRSIAHCGLEAPPRLWSLIAEGPHGGGEESQGLLVFVTRGDVGRLDVLTGRQVQAGREAWTRASTTLVSEQQARRTRLRPDFAYAVVAAPAPACLRGVVVRDRSGQVVKRSPPMPCREGSSFGLASE